MRTKGIRFASRRWCLMLLGASSGIPWPCSVEAMRGVVNDRGMLVYRMEGA